MDISDSISFGALIVSIITGIGFPFLQRPMLGYDTTPLTPKDNLTNVELYNITIHNIGITTLKNIIGTINMNVSNFMSEPFLSDSFHSNKYIVKQINSTAQGFFRIDVLPPQSNVNVELEIDEMGYRQDYPLRTYIAADEWIGYPTWYINTVNILALATAFILSWLCISIWRKY